MYSLIQLLILINSLNSIKSNFNLTECTVKDLTSDTSPIYLTSMSNEYLVTPIENENNSAIFGELAEVLVVCPSGFKSISYKKRRDATDTFVTQNKQFLMKCINGYFHIRTEDFQTELKGLKSAEYLRITNQLKCLNSMKSEMYQIKSNNTICNGKALSFSLNVKSSKIYFADACFNLNKMKLEYFHFKTNSFTSPVMSNNVITSPIQDLQLLKINPLPERFFISDAKIEEELTKVFNIQLNLTKYFYTDFYPDNMAMPYFYNPLKNYKHLQRFLGWSNFINGNWKLFNDLLKTRSETHSYDVYMGTSGVVAVLLDQNYYKNLIISAFNQRETVPKYVWTYLIEHDTLEKFVIIGINSPYVESKGAVICEDICDNIDWLNPMKEYRRFPSFGLMFCCKAESLSVKLEGFPKFV